jgi:4-methylaminobutanoate oxidase (formaldehyde-forming)
MKVLRKQLALARSFGVDCEEIGPRRASELFPVMRTDDLQGAIWIPGDGKVNPADLTMSLAKGARQRGAAIVEGAEVVGVTTAADGSLRRVAGVRVHHQGEEREIACETIVNCAGQWARQFGELAGVTVPLWSAEHFYVVTDRIEDVHPPLPVMRDPDGFIYYKEEATRCAGRARSSRPGGRCAPRRFSTCSSPGARCSAARTAGSARTTSGPPDCARPRPRSANPAGCRG